MATYSFTIPVRPFGKQRPRFGRGHTYTPKETVENAQLIAWHVRAHYKDKPIATGMIASVTFYMPIPNGVSKKKRIELENTPHKKKPDIDNLLKQLFDSLNSILYTDDALIHTMKAYKVYSANPRIELTIITD